MRRDILELDQSVSKMFDASSLTLADVEVIRLLLTGGSVVDWQRLSFSKLEEVDHFLGLHRLDMASADDCERLRYVFNESIGYLEEQLHLKFSPQLRDPRDVRDVFLWASQRGGFRRRQILSCVILKLMHVIHHMEAADLKFKTAISEELLFDLAEAQIARDARKLRESGISIVAFNSSRKSRGSIITKLLAKRETIAATIFDKLRFRLIVEQEDQLILALAALSRHLFPFNYCIPGESHNSIIHPDVLIEALKTKEQLQRVATRDAILHEKNLKNEFSGVDYKSINFIVDYPVRLPVEYLPHAGLELGRVVFVKVEFQVFDECTASSNEDGEGAHHLYKQRQHQVVERRLKRGRSVRHK